MRNKNQVFPADQIPPHRLDIEKKLLGILCMEGGAAQKVMNILHEDSFFSPAHSEVWKIIMELVQNNSPIDGYILLNKLESKKLISDELNLDFIVSLTNNVSGSSSLEEYARIIEEKAISRRSILIHTQAIQRLYTDEEDIQDILSDTDNELFDARKSLDSFKDVTMRSIGEQAKEQMRVARESGGMVGVPFGHSGLDGLSGGKRKKNLYMFAARTRNGKSAIAANCAYYAASNGYPTVFFTLEMDQVQFYFRLVSIRCRELGYKIPYSKIERGKTTEFEQTIVDQAIEDLNSMPFYIDDTPALTMLQFKSKLLKYINDYGVQDCAIDYVQLVKYEAKSQGKTTADMISDVMSDLKNTAKALDIPITALSQIDREVEKNGQKGRPVLVNMKGSGALEEKTDMVILLYIPEIYDPGAEDENGNSLQGCIYMDVAKNKMGQTELFIDHFDLPTNTFEVEDFVPPPMPDEKPRFNMNYYESSYKKDEADPDAPF